MFEISRIYGICLAASLLKLGQETNSTSVSTTNKGNGNALLISPKGVMNCILLLFYNVSWGALIMLV